MTQSGDGDSAGARHTGEDPEVRIVRRDGPANLDLIQPLWASYWSHVVQVGAAIGAAVPLDLSWQAARGIHEQWLRGRAGAFLLLALRGERPVGYALVVQRSVPRVTFKTEDLDIRIEALSVLPEEREHGVGGRLVERAAQEARLAGRKGISLTVLYDDEPTRAFYGQHGFVAQYLQMHRRLLSTDRDRSTLARSAPRCRISASRSLLTAMSSARSGQTRS